jgi:hypothetical protein
MGWKALPGCMLVLAYCILSGIEYVFILLKNIVGLGLEILFNGHRIQGHVIPTEEDLEKYWPLNHTLNPFEPPAERREDDDPQSR